MLDMSILVYDLILRVLELCCDDYAFLFRCSLVDWEFNRAASRFKPVLNLRDTNPVPESSNFASASLPHNSHYVLSLQVSGYVSARPPPRNTLSELLATAIKSFVNLHSVQFTPVTYHEELFAPSLPLLQSTHPLTNLTVNASCSNEARAPTLVQITGLHSLTLLNPGRAILQLLPEWLERLSSTLRELHLKDNCGSVTPGVLKSFVPYVKDNLQAFTLGLSYSLTDENVFTFLGSLTQLRRLNLRYYWQMKQPLHLPRLTSLRSFTAIYYQIDTAMEVTDFSKWVRRAIADLRTLKSFIRCPVAYDGLVDSVIKKHWATLRVLDLGAAVVSIRKLKEMLSGCLHVLGVFLAWGDFDPELARLRSVSFRLANAPHRFSVDDVQGLVATIMQKSSFSALRRLAINGITWEGSYTLNSDFQTKFIIRRAEDIIHL
ncbi:hypothetical protein BJ912DRAFT_977178, partial [Pholiota molesta]